MDNTQTLKHVSLCAGYGGIDLGLARALRAVRTVAFVEIEAFAVVNLVKKIEAGHLDECPIFTDLKAFPWELYRGRVDILSGGFPCQPFSAAGRRAGDSDPRHLWPYIADGLRRMGHPPLVFLENVEGIISSKLKGSEWADPEGTPVLLHVLRELERLGYQATAGVFSASEVGAPHQRKRVFILGCRSDLSETGRGLVDGLLRDTERGQSMGNDSCGGVQGSCGRWRSMQKGSHVSNREPSAGAGQEVAHTCRSTCRQRCRDSRATLEASRDRQASKLGGHGAARPVWPTPRGVRQYPWEPPRVTVGHTDSARSLRSRHADTTEATERRNAETRYLAKTDPHDRSWLGNTDNERLQRQTTTRQQSERLWRSITRSAALQRQTKSTLGRDPDGAFSGLDYAELCHTVDNRTDELRLLGNGVVPATAERAFRVLWKDLRAR